MKLSSGPRSTLRTRGGRPGLLAVLVGLMLVLSSCGIDAEQVTAGTTSPADTTTTEATTTTDPTGFTLPSIPTSEIPDPTAPATTTPTTTPPVQVTPGGVSETSLATQLVNAPDLHLTQEKAECVARAMFRSFTGEQIDEIYQADTQAQIDPDLAAAVVRILQRCLTGG